MLLMENTTRTTRMKRIESVNCLLKAVAHRKKKELVEICINNLLVDFKIFTRGYRLKS